MLLLTYDFATSMVPYIGTVIVVVDHAIAFIEELFPHWYFLTRPIALLGVCSFLMPKRRPKSISFEEFYRAAFGEDARELSKTCFDKFCQIVDVVGMGAGAKGVIAKIPIKTGTVVAIYFGVATMASYFKDFDDGNQYSVDVCVEAEGCAHHLVLVGSRDITGGAGYINDCRHNPIANPVATKLDRQRINVALMQINVCGRPLVIVIALKNIKAGGVVLLDYGGRYWGA